MKILFLLLCVSLLSCSSLANRKSASSVSEEQSNLTFVEAQARSKALSNVHYQLSVKLNRTANYSGEETIAFDLAPSSDNLRLDFFHGDVNNLEINGKKSSVSRTPTYLSLQKSLLQTGANTVKISFTTEMQTNGTGLHRFEDPEDKAVYIHTQLEAFAAHKFMPCFDQPDLKAVLSLQVTAPGSWTVVSTTRENTVDVSGDLKTWHFPETPPISTYLYSLHAGPLHIWEDNFEGIPLRLMARNSLAKFVSPELWLRTTKQGLGFYNKFFGYPYPFKKYDQLIMPEFNAGAMENVGAVTFSERYVRRGHMTREDQRDVASVLLHEMAHMWFGDLVTMRWWNDLWLNESFATYMSALAMAEATPFKESWVDFFSGTKLWAYYQDQLSTTHPIESAVPDTQAAGAAFDGITYGKGAAVIKQMSRWLGKDEFQRGVQDYMHANAYKNAELNDFIGSLQKFSKRDLAAWSKVWLQQAGLDTVRVNVSCKENRLERVTLDSTPSVAGNFRPQSIALGFFRLRGGALTLSESKSVEIQSAHQEFTFNTVCPDFVYPNYGDHGYMKVTLDQKSIPVLAESISSLPDSLSRLMVWSNLWQMVKDQEITLTEYAKIAASQLGNEKDEDVLRLVVASISGDSHNDLGSVIGYWPTSTPALESARNAFIAKMETIYREKLEQAPAGKDIQTFWWNSFVRVANSTENLNLLTTALKDKPFVKSLSLDQDRRWTVLHHLCRMGVPECNSLLAAEKAKDGSDRGLRSTLAAQAVFPDFTSKEKLLSEALYSTSLSLQQRKSIVRNIFPYEQKKAAERLESVFFSYFRENKHSSEFEVFETLTGNLSSLNCEARQSQKLRDFIAQNQDMPSPVLRSFQEDLDEDARCERIRAKAAAAN